MARDHLDQDGELDRLSTSWLGRGLKVSGMAARVAATVVNGSVRRLLAGEDGKEAVRAASDERVGREIVETFGTLKGAVMKVGQMMSYVDLAMPEPMRDALSALQSQSPPMAPDVIEALLADELGARPDEVFLEWSREPLAAASIGQVHRARLRDGTAVAVKVQYPGIVNALKADLRNASVLGAVGAVMGIDGPSRRGMVEELTERLLEECDYRKEAENQELFRRLYEGVPGVAVPRVHRDLSTERVLISDLVVGKTFQQLVTTGSQAQKNRAGEAIFRMAFQSIFQHHLFNCDPHPGNYLFQDNAVIFLDYGCVRRFEPARVAHWQKMMRSVLTDDLPGFKDMVLALGFARSEAGFDFARQMQLSRYLYTPWIEDRPFRYSRDYVEKSFSLLVKDNPNLKKTSMPRDFTFVNRLQWGLNSVLASLEAEANWWRIIQPLIALEAGTRHE